MTEAVLAWQALIFFSIVLAGRYRFWVIAFWVVWTALQVFTLPLSLLQFGTIAAAAALFRSTPSTGQSAPAGPNPTAKPTTLAATSPSQKESAKEPARAKTAIAEQGLLGKMEAWSAELKRKTDELAREQQFRLAAEQRIKTEGFSCVLEERVMKEALARDQQLTRDIESSLATDAVLARLYHAYLKEGGTLPPTVRDRQLAEEIALKSARTERDTLDAIIDGGPGFKGHYEEACRLLSELDAASLEAQRHLMLHDRHLDDWLADVQALRASRKASISSTAGGAAGRSMSPATPKTTTAAPVRLSKVPAEPPRQEEPKEPTAYVTRNTFKRVGNRLQPAEVSIDAVFTYIYKDSLRGLLNDTEAKRLYVLRCLLQGKSDQLVESGKTFAPGYVFSIGPSRYHASRECEFLKADFTNYLVPPEIEAQGAERVREFQQFCEDNKQLLRDKTPAAFWAYVGTRFRISSNPRHVQYANSGIQGLASGMGVVELQAHIDRVVAEAQGMTAQDTGVAQVRNVRYAPNSKRVLESIDDPQAKEAVQKFFELKRDVLDLMFEFYRRESGRDDLALPVLLLESAGLTPCRGCWNAGGAAQQAASRPH